jgi:sigma-B regulation protein RsbU (phosphoserine phosphatase)
MPVRILSVDDEQDLEILLTQYFRRKIKKGEYEFSFAHNGVEALQMILHDRPHYDIILSDINMPEMDGLTLLTKINELRNPALKCIMVSAYGDMENIRTAMNRGAFDFTTKPINLEDMELTIEKAVEQIRFIKNAQQEHSQLKSIQSDLKVAKEIQETILPKEFRPFPDCHTFDIYASMNAATYVGGDFYDFFRIDNSRLGFVIADVSGKGIPAAIFMAISRTVVRAIALTENSAAQCMQRSNKILCHENVNDMFVTVFYGILNINSGVITYCNAGHNPPVLIRKDGDASFVPMTNDMVLGAVPDIPYHEKELVLHPGDTLFLYTDGVTEAMNHEHERYGTERLLEDCKLLVMKSPEVLIREITGIIEGFTTGVPQSDDITLLSIAYKG